MDPSAEPTTVISVRMPERIREQLDALTTATGRSRQYHAAEALRRYIESETRQIDLIAKRLRQADAGEIRPATSEQVAAVFDRYVARRTEPDV